MYVDAVSFLNSKYRELIPRPRVDVNLRLGTNVTVALELTRCSLHKTANFKEEI